MSEVNSPENFKLGKDLKLGSEFSPPTFEEWKAKVEKDLKGASYEKKLITKTYEGISLNPIYTKADIKDSNLTDSLPGTDSFVRGFDSSGYHSNTWDVNQEILEADASEFNAALKEGLNNGQNCINLLLDSATKLGLDADYAEVSQVGDKGLSISAINSMKRAFNNVSLTEFSFYVDAGFNSVPFLSLLNAYCKANGTDISKLSGAVTSDPIAHLAVYGELPVNQKFVFDMMKNSLEWSIKAESKLRTIGVNTLPFVNAGANAVQELAYAMSITVFYINELVERNVDVKSIFNKIQFTMGISNNYFMEIAKFRAAKVLLSNIAEQYGVEDVNLNIGAKSSTFSQTVLDPYVNMLRATTQSFSAILGGVNNITTPAFDESIRKSDSFSRRIARNTQTVLREESHLDQVIDPAGGSYFIETLTEELAVKAWDVFKEIENEGGIFDSLSKGLVQNSIKEVVDVRKKDINKRKSVIVGTNMFADVNENKLEERKIDQKELKEKRSDYLKKFRLNGNAEKHQAVMEKLNSISDANSYEIIDRITEAYLLGTTIGEVNSVLTSSNKEKVTIEKLSNRRASEDFEDLRQKAIDYKDANGSLPKVYLANYGSLREYKGRADFSKGFFEVGGFDVIDPKGCSTTDEVVTGALESKAPIVVICSTDDNYPEIVPAITKGVKDKSPNVQIILAGYPKDQIEEHKNSGVDDFIFLGANVMEKLTTLYTKIGGQK